MWWEETRSSHDIAQQDAWRAAYGVLWATDIQASNQSLTWMEYVYSLSAQWNNRAMDAKMSCVIWSCSITGTFLLYNPSNYRSHQSLLHYRHTFHQAGQLFLITFTTAYMKNRLSLSMSPYPCVNKHHLQNTACYWQPMLRLLSKVGPMQWSRYRELGELFSTW